MTTPRFTSVLPALVLLVAACGAEEDDASFRSGYTTNTTLDGGDDGSVCEGEPGPVTDVNPRRSLFETNPDALSGFTMTAVLDAIAVNSGLVSQPSVTHDQFIDTYNEAPGLGLGANCDDALAFDGTPGLNGFPHICPRAEGNHIGDIEGWFPIAAVNRFDLAPSDGSHCGEARLVMANNSERRMFTIFEAQIPNPNPGCGIDACAPVQEFWAELSEQDNPKKRAEMLRLAFIDGAPSLEAEGFGPFMSQQNLTFGTGQVRTNNFDDNDFIWTLREFKVVPVGKPSLSAEFGTKPPVQAVARMVPVPVAANPFGEYWDDDVPGLPNHKACVMALLDTVEHLMVDDVNLMGVSVPTECLAAESPATNVQRYAQQLAGHDALAKAIDARIHQIDPTSTLTPADIANRAAFAGGCIGCHQQTNGIDLGNGVQAPVSGFFVHTSETNTQDCGDGTSCFSISPALEDDFLPHRKAVMDTYLSGGPCCDEPGFIDVDAEEAVPLSPDEPIPLAELMQAEADAKAAQSPTTIAGTPTARSH
ncbi:hypothetical protein PPSIR1_24629 [Plesiocystis pacifica SIR-1]|uniref:Cytochrome c domain-containing protein n=1 Tax=Plesiocystis pacifica SIR-1 TaxID=391625 RepID=A6GB73_9BACT|nr:hypothetical protein [Plesiocystis pacifica]EDM76870.1 hypothetical protein PPSIR1_24629 [Plesiocystis pacifica SIR-1]